MLLNWDAPTGNIGFPIVVPQYYSQQPSVPSQESEYIQTKIQFGWQGSCSTPNKPLWCHKRHTLSCFYQEFHPSSATTLQLLPARPGFEQHVQFGWTVCVCEWRIRVRFLWTLCVCQWRICVSSVLKFSTNCAHVTAVVRYVNVMYQCDLFVQKVYTKWDQTMRNVNNMHLNPNQLW